jgi:hypothetical protein
MTIAYNEPRLAPSRQWTGASLYDPVLLDPEEYEADQRRTHVVAAGIKDPVLRDTLAKFEDALIHKLTGLVARLPSVQGLANAAMVGDVFTIAKRQPYGHHWLSAGNAALQSYTVTGTARYGVFNVISAGVAGTAHVVADDRYGLSFSVSPAWVVGATTHVVTSAMRGIAFLDQTPALPAELILQVFRGGIQDPAAAPRKAAPLAVQAVEDISDWLGVPAADVFRATGIVKRTYQEWKKSGTRRPRSSSEGRLWELHQLSADLTETMGAAGVRRWFSQDPARRKLLRAGALDKLASEAYGTAKTTERPSWVGAGSVEDHALPRRKTALPPMDSGDIAEPGP